MRGPVLCPILTPARLLVLVGLGLGVGEGLGLEVGLGLGNQIAISTRGVIIWQGVENGHNTGIQPYMYVPDSDPEQEEITAEEPMGMNQNVSEC